MAAPRASSPEDTPTPAVVSVGSSSSSYRVPLLCGSANWRTWKVRMEDLLSELDLWDIVSGDTPRPSSSSSDWEKKDRKALGLIRRCVNDDIVLLILAATTSKAAWDTLRNTYEVVDIVALIDLRRRLFWTKMEEGTPIDKHIREMRSVYDQLRAINEDLSNDFDWALCLVNSLPASWRNFIQTLTPAFKYENKSDWPKLAQAVTQAVIAEGQRLAHDEQSESGMVAHGKATSSNSKSNGRRNRPQCAYCRRPGHTEDRCYKKRDDEAAKEKEKATVSWQTSEYAFTMRHSPLSRSAWLADSGTSSHVVPNRALFESYTPTPGARIQGAAGDAEIAGRGTIRAVIRHGSASHTLTLRDVAHVPSCPANLLSIRAIDSAGGSATFKHGAVFIRAPDGKFLGRGKSVTGHSGLYKLEMHAIRPRVQAGGMHEQSFYFSDIQRTKIEPAPSPFSPSHLAPAIQPSPSPQSTPAAASTRPSSRRAHSGAAFISPATAFAKGEHQSAPQTQRKTNVPQAHTPPHQSSPSAHALARLSSVASSDSVSPPAAPSDSVSPPAAPSVAPRPHAVPRAPSGSQSSPHAARAPPLAASRAIAARSFPTGYRAATPPLFTPARSPSPVPALSGALQTARASPLASPVLGGSLHADCDAGTLAAPISRAEGESQSIQRSKFSCDVPAGPTTPPTTSGAFPSAPAIPSVDPTSPRSSSSERSRPMRLAPLPHSLPSSRASSPVDFTRRVDLYPFGQLTTDNATATHRGWLQPGGSQQSECDHVDSAPIAAVPLPTKAETDPEVVQPASEESRRPSTPGFVPSSVRASSTQVPRRLSSPSAPTPRPIAAIDVQRPREQIPPVYECSVDTKVSKCAPFAHSEPELDDSASESSRTSNFRPSEPRSTLGDHVRPSTRLYPSYLADISSFLLLLFLFLIDSA
jgi:hypothetical protein